MFAVGEVETPQWDCDEIKLKAVLLPLDLCQIELIKTKYEAKLEFFHVCSFPIQALCLCWCGCAAGGPGLRSIRT